MGGDSRGVPHVVAGVLYWQRAGTHVGGLCVDRDMRLGVLYPARGAVLCLGSARWIGDGRDTVAFAFHLFQASAYRRGRYRLLFQFLRCYRSEEHTSELQSLMRISYAVFCLKKKNNNRHNDIPKT